MIVTGFDHSDRIDLRAAVTLDNVHVRNHLIASCWSFFVISLANFFE